MYPNGVDMEKPKFDIEVKLVGGNGNAFAVMHTMSKALRKAGATEEQMTEFKTQAMGGDYDHLLATCMEWVNVT